jgi:hypothetical protein
MEYMASPPAVVMPPTGTEIFIHADFAGSAMAGCVVGNDERQMVVARVDVDVGDHGHLQLAAFFPNQAELGTIELDNSVVETMRVDVIVKEELLDSAGPTVGTAKQERAALALTTGAESEFINTRIPNPRAADQPRRPAESCAQQRWK